MSFRIESLVSCLIVLTLLLFAGSAAAQRVLIPGSAGARDVSPRCAAAIDRAAADYSRCLLRAEAEHARDENARKLERRQAHCETRLDRVTGHHEPGECTSDALVASFEDRTASYADSVAKEARGSSVPSFLFVQNATGGSPLRR